MNLMHRLDQIHAKDMGFVVVLFGGQSAEREISLQSGKAVAGALIELGIKHQLVDVGPDMATWDTEPVTITTPVFSADYSPTTYAWTTDPNAATADPNFTVTISGADTATPTVTITKSSFSDYAKIINAGFEGNIVPINPSADEVLGLKCYPDPLFIRIEIINLPGRLAVFVYSLPDCHDSASFQK